MAREFDLIVAGELNPDLILSGDVVPAFDQAEKLVERAALTIGSSSAIFACGAARLGMRVAFIGLVGDDLFGHFMLDALQERGINISRVISSPEQNTGLSVILNRGADRAILTYPGCMADLRAEQVTDEILARGRHLHIASYFLQTALQPGLPELFWRAQRLGLSTSLDTNWDPAERWRGLDKMLPLVDIFLPNEAECRAIAGGQDLEAALDRLSAKAGMVVVKRGAKGAILKKGEEKIEVGSIPVQVADTVGAGDSFDAGFIAAYLFGWDLEKVLRLAAVCGALSTRAAGGTEAQPGLGEAQEVM